MIMKRSVIPRLLTRRGAYDRNGDGGGMFTVVFERLCTLPTISVRRRVEIHVCNEYRNCILVAHHVCSMPGFDCICKVLSPQDIVSQSNLLYLNRILNGDQ